MQKHFRTMGLNKEQSVRKKIMIIINSKIQALIWNTVIQKHFSTMGLNKEHQSASKKQNKFNNTGLNMEHRNPETFQHKGPK